MVNLVIDNSYSQITGLSAKEEKDLRTALSYVVGGSSAHFSGFGVKRRSLLDKKGFFPTGLLYRVVSHFSAKKCDAVDLRIKPQTNRTSGVTIGYPWQIEAEIIARRCMRGIISAPTGSGKSRVISLIAQNLGVKTLVVVPSLEIKKQLADTLKELKNVTVLNIDSKELQTATEYDCLIIDEAHHVAARTYQKLNKTTWKGIYYRFFLTATPFRNDTEETLLFESIAGSLIYQLTYPEAIKNNYIVPVESYYLESPKQDNDCYSWSQVYNQLIVNNTPRNTLICGLLARLHSAQKPTLCLVKEVAHGQILADMTGLPFVSGADDDSRKHIKQFNAGNIKVLIATTGIMGEGIDSKPCEYVIVAGLGKAKSQFMQQVGRAVRTYPGKETAKVVLVKDKSHKFTLRHYNAQVKILKEEYGCKPMKLELK